MGAKIDTHELYTKKRCARCGKTLNQLNFYKDKDSKRADICRTCMVKDIDIKKPSTFLPYLEMLDYPFIEGKWLETCKKQYAKDPDRFDPQKILGIYIRTLQLGTYSTFRYKDSEEATKVFEARACAEEQSAEAHQKRMEEAKKAREAELARREKAKKEAKEEAKKARAEAAALKKQEEKAWLEAREAEIREARRRRQEQLLAQQAAQQQASDEVLAAIKQPTDSATDFGEEGVLRDGLVGRPMVKEPKKLAAARKKTAEEKERVKNYKKMVKEETAAPAKRKKKPSKIAQAAAEQVVLTSTPTVENSVGILSDRQLAAEQSITNKLTEDDIRHLTLKWGDTYRPSEWLRMEEMYQRYASEFELSVDREQTLRQICKVSLKLDQAIDAGEYSDSAKLSSMLDNLRKSGKFTEVQNKEEKDVFISSLGQLVEQVERIGGIIPPFDVGTDYPQDKIDITIQDNQRFTASLVKEEAGLSSLIESYIQKMEAAQVAEARNKDANEDLDEIDYSEYYQAQVQVEADKMFAELDKEE